MKSLKILGIIIVSTFSISCNNFTSGSKTMDVVPDSIADVEIQQASPSPLDSKSEQLIRMKDDFNPTVQISSKYKTLPLKEVFHIEFKQKAIKSVLIPNLRQILERKGAIRDGVIDLTIAGPLDWINVEYLMGKSGSSSYETYLMELPLYKMEDDRLCKNIPMDSKLAKAYLLQDIKSFCKDNYELVEKWCKEFDAIDEKKEREKIENNQKKYL